MIYEYLRQEEEDDKSAENVDDHSRSLHEHAKAQKDLEGQDKAENRVVVIQ